MEPTRRIGDLEKAQTRKALQTPPNSRVYVLNRELRIISAYGVVTAQPQSPPTLLVGRRLQELVPPDIYCELIPYLEVAFGGSEVSYELTYPAGETIDAHAIPLPDADGSVQQIMVVAFNITDRKSAEAALVESERFARASLDSLSSHIAIVDASGNILAVNQAWRDFAAANAPASANVCEGSNYFDVCASASGEGSDEALQFLTAMRAVLAGTLDHAVIEYPCHSPDEQRWFIGRIRCFQDGEPQRVVVAHENITQRKLMEIALHEREARYRSVFENNHCVMLLVDPQSSAIFDANLAATAYYGWTREELRQKKISEINTLPPAEIEIEMALAASDRRNHFFFRHRRSDGSIRDVEVHSGPILINNRRLIYSIVHDISDRKRAQEALRQSEEVLRRSQAVAHVGHWTWDIHTNTVAWSDEMKRIFGLEPEAFDGDLNAVIERSIHPEDAPRLQALNSAVMNGQRPEAAEYRVVWSDGSIHHVRAIPSARTLDEEGRLVQLAGVVQDITDRTLKEMEREQLLQQLQSKAEQLTQVMHSVPEGVLLLDSDAHVLMANPRADAMLAKLGAYDAERRLLSFGGVALDALLTSPPAGQYHQVQAQKKLFKVIVRSLESGPMPAGWVMVVRDITAEQQVQQQLQQQERLAAVGQLAAGIAHDFNNILSVIAIYAELLGNAPELTEQARARAATIGAQTQRATRMIRQILDFSRQSVFERHALDLLPLLKEQQKLLRQALPENIQVDLAYEPGEYFVRADPTRIQQLVMNLAINARDAMPEGGVLKLDLSFVSVQTKGKETPPGIEPGRWLRLVVRDNGAGIAAEHLAHIFEPFFTTKAPGEGTGLGLAQAHGIVAQHDGHITVASESGAGAAFTCYLPALIVEMPAKAAGAEYPQLARGLGERVLVVEDDASVRASLADLLDLWNYHVIEAANGEDALAYLAAGAAQVDLIISDVMMPRLGGVGLVKQLRQKAIQTPVILLSGHMLDHNQDALQEKGVYAWLDKPPNSARLADTIARALANRGVTGSQPPE